MRYARECLSWERKAQVTSQILTWAVGQGPKPDLPLPIAAPSAKFLAHCFEKESLLTSSL
jgi:hypothetical protein